MFGTRQKKLALLLGATASAWSIGAFADIDLTKGATADPVEIQTESNIAATGTTVAGLFGDLDVKTDIGAGFSVNEKIYMRYDLINGTFAAGLSASGVTVTDLTGNKLENVVVSQGGLEGDSWVVYSGTIDTGGIDQTNDLNLNLGLAGVTVNDQNPVTVIYGLYEGLSAAANENNPVAQVSGTAITFKSGITITPTKTTVLVEDAGDLTYAGTAGSLVAEVESDFLNFGTSSGKTVTTVQLGTVSLTASGARAPDGVSASGLDVYAATSTMALSGDFQLAWDDDVTPAATDLSAVYLEDTNCGVSAGAKTATAVANDVATFTVDPAGDAYAAYAVCLRSHGDAEILASDYSIAFNGVGVATTITPVTGASVELGSISRNGVVVQIPYLTTFEGYRQRIIIVNRNAKAIEIAGMTFTPEEGATATSKMTTADMMIEANKSKILLVEDIVDISGDRTRTAATVSIVAKAGTIDVATQQVNLGDGATDTVEYTAN